jgi:hypothetical protein
MSPPMSPPGMSPPGMPPHGAFAPMGSPPNQPLNAPPMGSAPQMQPQSGPPARPSMVGGSPYPVLSGGRPMSGDLAPSNLPTPQHSPFADKPLPQPEHAHPMHAANVVSPVGEQFPHPIDWSAAAARPAKAIPPWLLGVLFVGALGIALMVTIIIAKIVH